MSDKTPLLNELLAEYVPAVCGPRVVIGDRGEVDGYAADGVWVNLGADAEEAERYLETHPTPETW